MHQPFREEHHQSVQLVVDEPALTSAQQNALQRHGQSHDQGRWQGLPRPVLQVVCPHKRQSYRLAYRKHSRHRS